MVRGVPVFQDNWTMTFEKRQVIGSCFETLRCTLHIGVIKNVSAFFYSDDMLETVLAMADIINWLPHHLR